MYRVKTLPSLSFEAALKLAFSRLTDFKGRSRRSEYWYCYLAVVLVNLFTSWIPIVGGIISIAANLFLIPPTFRRLHDTGHSGWWWGAGAIIFTVSAVIIGLSVFTTISTGSYNSNKNNFALVFLLVVFLIAVMVYAITITVFLCQDSDKRPNKYGPSPKHQLFKVQ